MNEIELNVPSIKVQFRRTKISFSKDYSRLVLHLLPALVPFLLFLGLGNYGINYRLYWDEAWDIDDVRNSLNQGTLVSTFYHYPGFAYWLTLAAVVPDIPDVLNNAEPVVWNYGEENRYNMSVMPELAKRAADPHFKFRVRQIKLFVSSLSILWIYGLIYVWKKDVLMAFIGATVHSLSWEVLYHSRFASPDGYTMQFVILALLVLLSATLYPHKRWLMTLGAVACGMVIASKYNHGLVILPLLFTAYLLWDKSTGILSLLKTWIRLIVIMFITFLVLNPGTLLTPEIFMRDVIFLFRNYGRFAGASHQIEGGWQHLQLILNFLTLKYFSVNETISIFFTMIALFGLAYALYKDWRRTSILLIYVVPTIFYMSGRDIFYGRNYLPQTSLCAIAFAIGVVGLIQIGRKVFKTWSFPNFAVLLFVPIVIAGGFNLNWQYSSSESIRNQSAERFAKELLAYVEANPETQFVSTLRVFQELRHFDLEIPENLHYETWDNMDVGIFFQVDIARKLVISDDLIAFWIGPHSINLHLYPEQMDWDNFLFIDADKFEPYEIVRAYCNLKSSWGIECGEVPDDLDIGV